MNSPLFEELNLRLETIEGQRNRALTDHAIVSAKLALASAEVLAARARIKELEEANIALRATLPQAQEA